MIVPLDVDLEFESAPTRWCLEPRGNSNFSISLVINSTPDALPGSYFVRIGGFTSGDTVTFDIGASGIITTSNVPTGIYGSANLIENTAYRRVYSWVGGRVESLISPLDILSGLPPGPYFQSFCLTPCSEWSPFLPVSNGTAQVSSSLYKEIVGFSTGVVALRDPGTAAVSGNPTNVVPLGGCPPLGSNNPIGPVNLALSYNIWPPGITEPTIPEDEIPEYPIVIVNTGGTTIIVTFTVNGQPLPGEPLVVPPEGSTTITIPVYIPGTEIQPTVTYDDPVSPPYLPPPLVWNPNDPGDPTNDGPPESLYVPPPGGSPDPNPGPIPEPNGDGPGPNFPGCIQRVCSIPYLYKYKSKP